MAELGIGGKNGLHIAFDNGYTLSIQVDKGSYCNARDTHTNTSPNAEVAVWESITGDWVRLTDADDIRGYVPINEIITKLPLLNKPEITRAEIISIIGA